MQRKHLNHVGRSRPLGGKVPAWGSPVDHHGGVPDPNGSCDVRGELNDPPALAMQLCDRSHQDRCQRCRPDQDCFPAQPDAKAKKFKCELCRKRKKGCSWGGTIPLCFEEIKVSILLERRIHSRDSRKNFLDRKFLQNFRRITNTAIGQVELEIQNKEEEQMRDLVTGFDQLIK